MGSLPSAADIAQFVDNQLRGQIDPNATGAYDNQPGSDNAKLVSVLTQAAMQQYAYTADRKAASITASAQGTDLTDHTRDVFGEDKQLAQAAVGTVYLKRPGPGTLVTSIPQGTRFGVRNVGTQKAVEFEATADVPAASGLLVVAVPVRCKQLGIIGKVPLASVLDIRDPLGDQTWALYVPIGGDAVLGGRPAPDVIGGGRETETDDELKARVAQRPAIPQPGTKAGIVKGATDVPGIVTAVPVEVGDGTGVLYAGDPGYLLPSAIQQAVATELEDWRPFGVPVRVSPFSAVLVQVTAQVYMQQPLQNYDLAALTLNAINAVIRHFTFERLRPDEYFVDAIKTAIAKSNVGTQSVVLSLPASDQRRPADSAYGAVTALNRYYVTSQSVSVQFNPPLTS